jgi:hypothetical protein
VLSPAWGLGVAVANESLCTWEVPLLLSAIGGRHQAVKSGQVAQETHQTPATRPDCHADHRVGKHDAVSKRQTGTAVQERGAGGAAIEALVPHAPGLQGGSGPLEGFGGLTRGAARRAQRSVLRQEVRPFASIPACLATRVAGWPVVDDGAHRDRLCSSRALQ